MRTNAPVIFIDDDKEDLQVFSEAMKAIGAKNEVICFDDSTKAMDFLSFNKKRPLFIMCDINMPKLGGLALRERLVGDVSLLLAATPFMYLSTASPDKTVNKGYGLNIQGYFQKPSDFAGIKALLRNLVAYWTVAKPPGHMTDGQSPQPQEWDGNLSWLKTLNP